MRLASFFDKIEKRQNASKKTGTHNETKTWIVDTWVHMKT